MNNANDTNDVLFPASVVGSMPRPDFVLDLIRNDTDIAADDYSRANQGTQQQPHASQPDGVHSHRRHDRPPVVVRGFQGDPPARKAHLRALPIHQGDIVQSGDDDAIRAPSVSDGLLFTRVLAPSPLTPRLRLGL